MDWSPSCFLFSIRLRQRFFDICFVLLFIPYDALSQSADFLVFSGSARSRAVQATRLAASLHLHSSRQPAFEFLATNSAVVLVVSS